MARNITEYQERLSFLVLSFQKPLHFYQDYQRDSLRTLLRCKKHEAYYREAVRDIQGHTYNSGYLGHHKSPYQRQRV